MARELANVAEGPSSSCRKVILWLAHAATFRICQRCVGEHSKASQ